MAARQKQIDLRSLCRSYTEANVRILGGFASSPEVHPRERISAIEILLERGWGKAPQIHSGEDGGDITIVIRHIIEGVDRTTMKEVPAAQAQLAFDVEKDDD